MQGKNPYAYVGDNPETRNDPSGHCWPLCTMILGAIIGAAVSVTTTVVADAVQGKTPSLGEVAQAAVVGAVSGAVSGLVGPEAGPLVKVAVGALAAGAGQIAGNAMSGKPLLAGVGTAVAVGALTGGLMEGAGALFKGAASDVGEAADSTLSDLACSFTPQTLVTTSHGKQPIGKLRVGEQVLAYNPKTHRMEDEPILHVWIHTDTDLVDLTVTTKTHAPHSTATTTSETIHTNKKHPFLTEEKGFLPVAQLKLGMHILRANGQYGVITGWRVAPGSSVMYNLTVSQDHTFTVGIDQWVVHNTCGPVGVTEDGHLFGRYSDLENYRPSGTGYEIHHIFQQAMMKSLEDYDEDDAPAVLLFGSVAQEDSEHWATRVIQRAATTFFRGQGLTSLTFDQASTVAQDALTFADLSSDSVDQLMGYASSYFRERWIQLQLDDLRVPLR